MSNREQCVNILDSLNENQLAYLLPMLQNFRAALEEAEDDAYCRQLYLDTLEENAGGEAFDLEDCMKEWGLA